MKRIAATALVALTAAATPIFAGGHLLIFGGRNHDVFLGCLTCAETDPASVHNTVGQYGSDVAAKSVLNDVGIYGSEVSPTSACNDIASSPPIVVDDDGNSYGLLTTNDMKMDRVNDEKILRWLYGVACR